MFPLTKPVISCAVAILYPLSLHSCHSYRRALTTIIPLKKMFHGQPSPNFCPGTHLDVPKTHGFRIYSSGRPLLPSDQSRSQQIQAASAMQSARAVSTRVHHRCHHSNSSDTKNESSRNAYSQPSTVGGHLFLVPLEILRITCYTWFGASISTNKGTIVALLVQSSFKK